MQFELVLLILLPFLEPESTMRTFRVLDGSDLANSVSCSIFTLQMVGKGEFQALFALCSNFTALFSSWRISFKQTLKICFLQSIKHFEQQNRYNNLQSVSNNIKNF